MTRNIHILNKIIPRTQRLRPDIATSGIIVLSATAQEWAMEASLRVSWILGKHKKLLCGNRECMNEVQDVMLEGTQKDEIIQKNKILLSDSTAARRTEVLANDLLFLIFSSAVKRVEFISLAVDE